MQGVRDPQLEKLASMRGLCKRLTIVMHILEQEVRQGWTGERRRPTVIFSIDIKAIWLDFMK